MEEDFILDFEEEQLEYRYSITSYGADYPVDSIVKRIKDNVIFVPPFQRKFVWNISQSSRFIESLILGLPVPGIFLSKDQGTNRLIIIDGQQRLLSLSSFYDGIFKDKIFTLQGVQSDLEGRSYKDLNPEDRLRLDDSIIHATIIKQDEPDDNESSVYMIFERLNTGGRPLTSQEIRACIYYGSFNEFLNELTENKEWRSLFGKRNERMKEQELILRFFALYYYSDSYSKPLKSFLNSFMVRNREFGLKSRDDLGFLFQKTIEYISNNIGSNAFKIGKIINAAAFDSIMIGIAKRLIYKEVMNPDELIKRHEQLVQNRSFIEATKSATSDEKIVNYRIDLAIKQFHDVK
jgi:uncharacterized protein with ParB-like and HNH nuclease domain